MISKLNTLVLAGAAFATFLVSMAAAKGTAHSDLFPTKLAHKWTYTFHSRHGGSKPVDRISRRQMPGKDSTITEFHVEGAGYGHYEYWASLPTGLYRYANTSLGDHPGVNADKATLILKYPIEKGVSWEYSGLHSVQTIGDSRPDPESLKFQTTAVIEATDEPVTVPAGTFKAVRVKHTEQSVRNGKTVTTYWFASGIGLVKQEVRDAQNHLSYELVSYGASAETPRG